jgi:hypothetical protein
MEPSTYTVETSAGRMEARWGWNGWISLTTPRSSASSHAAKRLVEHRDDLEELLVGFGLSVTESRRIAKDLWAERPDGEPAEEDAAEPVRSPMLLLVGAVALIVIAVLVLIASAT